MTAVCCLTMAIPVDLIITTFKDGLGTAAYYWLPVKGLCRVV